MMVLRAHANSRDCRPPRDVNGQDLNSQDVNGQDANGHGDADGHYGDVNGPIMGSELMGLLEARMAATISSFSPQELTLCLTAMQKMQHTPGWVLLKVPHELLDFLNWASCVTFLMHVGWPPHFVGVKPQVYVPTYWGYVPWDGLGDGKSKDQ
jgi:hypothetical protein